MPGLFKVYCLLPFAPADETLFNCQVVCTGGYANVDRRGIDSILGAFDLGKLRVECTFNESLVTDSLTAVVVSVRLYRFDLLRWFSLCAYIGKVH